jgi:lipoprotein-releasing system permease protein
VLSHSDTKLIIFLNLSYFISKRISSRDGDSFSGTIHTIAVASIGIGLAIMVITILILKGFQLKIQEKIYSFDGHLQVTKFTLSRSYEEDPISRDLPLFQHYSDLDYIDHVQEYANKAGLLKANEEVMGVVLKGVSESFRQSPFSQNIVRGRLPEFNQSSSSTELMISKSIADKLMLDIGDEPLLYFMQNPPRVRKMTITGIYESGMSDFDEQLVLGDLRLVQRINNWSDSLVGGYEIFLKNPRKMDIYHDELEDLVGYELYVQKINDKFAEIFDWLSLLNKNVAIFLSLTLFVACFNMISILLILIMERTHMIGVLKSFGSPGKLIRRIFVYNGMRLILKGMLLGNLIGVLFGLVQGKYQVLPLDAKNYYMDFVPISWDWFLLITLNIFTFAVVSLTLSIPTMIINRITPIKSIRFD